MPTPAEVLLDKLATPDELILDFPNVDDGVRGMKFIDAVIKNNSNNEKWISI